MSLSSFLSEKIKMRKNSGFVGSSGGNPYRFIKSNLERTVVNIPDINSVYKIGKMKAKNASEKIQASYELAKLRSQCGFDEVYYRIIKGKEKLYNQCSDKLLEAQSSCRELVVYGASKPKNFKEKIGEKFNKIKSAPKDISDFYKSTFRSVIGVDITPHSIYVCQIDALNGNKVLTGLSSVCMEGKFVTEDIVNDSVSYVDGLKLLIDENDIKTKNVALSIPVSSSIVRTISLPKMNDKEIQKAMEFGSIWQNISQISGDPSQYSVFYQVLRRRNNENTMDVLVVATKLPDVNLYTEIVRKSGLRPTILDIRCFALRNAHGARLGALHNKAPSAFMEFNAEDSYLMIIDEGKPYVYDIYVSDLERTSILDENIYDDEVVEEFILNCATQIRHIISRHENKFKTMKIAELQIASSLLVLEKFMSRMALYLEDMVVSECNFFDAFDIPDGFAISKSSSKENISAWAAAIGMALREMGFKDFLKSLFGFRGYNPNILEYKLRYRKARKIKVRQAEHGIWATLYGFFQPMAYASIVMLLFLIAELGYNSIPKSENIEAKLASLSGVENQYQQELASLKELEEQEKNVETIAKKVSYEASNQEYLLAAFKVLNSSVPEGVWLKEIEYNGEGRLMIIGNAFDDESILNFINKLNKSDGFSEVSMKNMESVREIDWQMGADPVKVFTIYGSISPNLIKMPKRTFAKNPEQVSLNIEK